VNHYKLQHANIVGFRQAFLTEAHLCIVVELCVKQSLIEFVLAQPASQRTGRPCASEAQTRVATQQMLCAVAYAHANGVVHRDLKARLTRALALTCASCACCCADPARRTRVCCCSCATRC
jgi:serine/threonine protein kinase